MTGEPEAIGMINVAKRLFDAGYNKECDSVLDLCKNIFPRESSHCGSLWKSTQVSYGPGFNFNLNSDFVQKLGC